jgi:hypothetical protein
LGALNGIAVAISPVAEYAVTLSTGSRAGMSNATNRSPSTSTGCRVSTVPSDSWTRAETTPFHTAPKLTKVGLAALPPPPPAKLIGSAALGCPEYPPSHA